MAFEIENISGVPGAGLHLFFLFFVSKFYKNLEIKKNLFMMMVLLEFIANFALAYAKKYSDLHI